MPCLAELAAGCRLALPCLCPASALSDNLSRPIIRAEG